jgi:hypothetical protein
LSDEWSFLLVPHSEAPPQLKVAIELISPTCSNLGGAELQSTKKNADASLRPRYRFVAKLNTRD